MKSEHRHDLQTNYLSAGLARWIDKIKPFTGQIVTGAVLFALVYAGLTVWDAQSNEQERAAWDAFALATDTNDPELKSLQRVAGDEKYAGTKMQEWAYVGWADRQVLNAMGSYLYDRKRTNDLLRSVSGVYEELASTAGDPQVLNRARFGLARVYELQNKLDEARTQYLTVRGDLEPQASDRARQLDSENVRATCDWLATTDLPKRDLTGGQGATGVRPEFDASLPTTKSTLDSISEKSLEELLGVQDSETTTEENRYGEKEESSTEVEKTSETEESLETEASADASKDGGGAASE